jgi:hypothetical protein
MVYQTERSGFGKAVFSKGFKGNSQIIRPTGRKSWKWLQTSNRRSDMLLSGDFAKPVLRHTQ